MSNKIYSVLIILLAVLLVSGFMITPAAAQQDADDDEPGNIICYTDNDGDFVPTDLGELISTLALLLVTVAALIAVVGGAIYTLASAANPTDEDYIKKRNNSVKYGAGTLIILYAANTIIREFDENLDFGCILPFA